MFANTQLLGVTTPLGDAVSLSGFRAREALSQPFAIDLDLIARNDAPDVFRGLLGQPISVQARAGGSTVGVAAGSSSPQPASASSATAIPSLRMPAA